MSYIKPFFKFPPATMASSSVSSALQPVNLPRWDHRLPCLYLANSHPLVRGEHGKIVIMLQDRSTEAMANNLDAASEMEVPATKLENEEKGQWLSVESVIPAYCF
jgi:hypothetical protein